ncbi:transposon, En/Spm-like protein [Tanacetum coccineum]
MVIDADGPDLREFFAKEAPNSNAAKFFELLRCADEPLWDGSKNHTRLSAVSLLMNVKSDCNMSESCYNRVISAVKSIFMHVPMNVVLERTSEKKKCMVCGHLRFTHGKEVRGKARVEVPFKVLRYLPLALRLQRLFMSNKTATYMSWHKYDRRLEGVLTHPCDGEAWKHIDRVYPSFAVEERNVRLGLSTDGFLDTQVYHIHVGRFLLHHTTYHHGCA